MDDCKTFPSQEVFSKTTQPFFGQHEGNESGSSEGGSRKIGQISVQQRLQDEESEEIRQYHLRLSDSIETAKGKKKII